MALALLVGAGAGLGAVAFRWMIRTFTLLLSGHADYSAAGHAANPHVPWLGRFFVLLAPVVAGLIYGPLVQRYAREARGHGVPEVMYAVARRGGKIAPQVALVKSLASALCIGGGGSVGREGPIVQIGSALGSSLGGWVKVAEDRLKILVACGAAGGIAATFNAPLAGVFFAMELILRDFTAESFGMVVLASVTASVIGRAALGNNPFLHLPPFQVQHLSQYLLFALLGLLAGVLGVVFSKVLYRIEDACDAVWRGPEWARPAVGGLLLGLLLLVLPEMYGVGYPVLENAVGGKYVIGFLVVLLVGKIVATSLTIGIGGSGGVFAPSLFMGAMLGSAFGAAAHHLLPGVAGPVGAYGLIGMGAVFAGAARAPITAVIILFELTGEYTIILPLMTAIVLATLVSRALSHETIYTAKLRRRGIDLDAPNPDSPVIGLTVRDALEPIPGTLGTRTTLAQAADDLARSPHGILPVVAADGSYQGTATARGVAEALAEGTGPTIAVGRTAHLSQALSADTSLDDALQTLATSGNQGLPVLDDNHTHLLGWISHQSILTTLHQPEPARTSTPTPTAPPRSAT
ncbi:MULTISPECIES: chloride channel protein [Streptacidiphilus]|uniref:Chloride channel protein n=1 Tax=Streptacidiphilus cavernicola TaxID=3342716 RepID=A0ABV6V1E5_9ACTN|nr:chloride channel protein [Streptacidiphilus jeojiense]